MYIEGYKTLSHISALEYLSKNYNILSDNQLHVIDTSRKFRYGIVYYGKKISGEYLINNENEIKMIINSLIKLAEDEINSI